MKEIEKKYMTLTLEIKHDEREDTWTILREESVCQISEDEENKRHTYVYIIVVICPI